jgi:hypothetical protein
MKKFTLIWLLTIVTLANSFGQNNYPAIKNAIRPSAYPLITIDPYTNGWAFSDNLYDESVKHWTGKSFPLLGVIKVDNKLYRFMGTEEIDLSVIAKTSVIGEWTGKYVTKNPADNWYEKSFDDSAWATSAGAFGTTNNEPTARTHWDSKYIWVRRVIKLDKNYKGKNVYLEYSHDDDAIIYVNGIKAVDTGQDCKKNVKIKLSEEAVNSLVKGDNVIAGYCYNRGGNGLLDFGLLVENDVKRSFSNTAIQTSVDVQATQTYYTFTCGGVDLKLIFTAPLLLEDLDLASRPVNYISYEINSNDGKNHNTELYFEASPQWAVDQPMQETEADSYEKDGLIYLKTGTKAQEILAKRGDDRRIDWGYFYLVAEKSNTIYGIGSSVVLRNNFVKNVKSNYKKEIGNHDVLSLTRSLGTVGKTSGKIMIGYDDIYSIQYFDSNLRPYWNRANNQTISNQFAKANDEYPTLMNKCYKFDQELMNQATAAGGKQYAELCALAYRQSISAHKLVEAPNGDLLFLSKENFSNGSIGTVDITYPSAPLYLLYNPELAKGLLNHIFYFSESGRWTKPFAAHDVGTYPLANGQTYGGDMPVEENGNMLILNATITIMEGNAEYAARHWNVLTTWTDYLVKNGLDPDNQLCTDDFAGHFAHNANLSIKAILGVASYAYMADMLGKKTVAEKYNSIAKAMAKEWERMDNDNDHYRLTFDKSGTWSQKYNLVWDKLMNMNIFSKEIAPKEIAYYLTKQNKYGLPLDSRASYTKTDWIIWTATLAKDKATFERFISPLHLFMNETVDRIPMSDWIYTDRPKHTGFRARSVVGGYFIKMLEEKMAEKK